MAKRRRRTGLYEGEAGEYAAQQDPLAYLSSINRMRGGYPSAGSPFEQYLQGVHYPGMYSKYQGALAKNEQLTLQDFAKKQGKRVPVRDFRSWYQEQNPQMTYDAQRRKEGLLGSISETGNSGYFQNFVNTTGYQNDRAAYEKAFLKNPNQTFSGWMKGKKAKPFARKKR
jgi:hypothetical protein